MKNVGLFEKVSFEKFIEDCRKYMSNLTESDEYYRRYYDSLALPRRSTPGSAGYDFGFPLDKISIAPKSSVIIPTGIKVRIDAPDYYLKVVPKSGLSRRYRTEIVGTEGIIDADYYYSDAEGHIMIQLVNNNDESKVLKLENNTKFCQGIFSEYGTIIGDDPIHNERVGGFGSTGETLK